jgi:hypothetical protein
MTEEKTGGIKCEEVAGLNMPGRSVSPCSGLFCYEIRIKQPLDMYWFEWFDGWKTVNLENGDVLLQIFRVDQSSLHGALNKIHDLNLTLLGVTCFPLDG